jgi:hypothetical protein
MNAATFFVYNLVMKSCGGLAGSNGAAEAASGGQAWGGLQRVTAAAASESSWSRRRSERLTTITTTITTDMPTILLVKQNTAISQVETTEVFSRGTLIKKKIHSSCTVYKEIQKGAVAKSYTV